MSYIYIYMERLFLMFLDHTQRRSKVGKTPLDEWSARRRDLYLTTHDTHNRQQPAAAHLLRSWVRIPPGTWIFVCCECRVLSGRGLRWADHSSRGVLPTVVRHVWSRTSRMGAPYIYIYMYIYDISSLRVYDLTLILLTWRKWWTPNNASKQQMGFNSAIKGLKNTVFVLPSYCGSVTGQHSSCSRQHVKWDIKTVVH